MSWGVLGNALLSTCRRIQLGLNRGLLTTVVREKKRRFHRSWVDLAEIPMLIHVLITYIHCGDYSHYSSSCCFRCALCRGSAVLVALHTLGYHSSLASCCSDALSSPSGWWENRTQHWQQTWWDGESWPPAWYGIYVGGNYLGVTLRLPRQDGPKREIQNISTREMGSKNLMDWDPRSNKKRRGEVSRTPEVLSLCFLNCGQHVVAWPTSSAFPSMVAVHRFRSWTKSVLLSSGWCWELVIKIYY